MYIIDAHNHPEWHGHNFEKTIENMDKYGIAKTWLLSWECPENEYDPRTNRVFPVMLSENKENHSPVPFSLVLKYKEKAPERFILGYAPDPRRPEAVDLLRGAVATWGVRVCGEIKLRMMYDNPDAVRMFRYCGEAGLPVTLHFDNDGASLTGASYPRASWWYGGDINTLERLLALCPETNFLGHAPGFWCHISNDNRGETEAYPDGEVIPGGKIERLLEKYPNLYCDISAGSGRKALSRDKAYTTRLLNTYPTRFLYARDYFDNVHQELLNSLQLSPELLENIYHRNAERLLGEIK